MSSSLLAVETAQANSSRSEAVSLARSGKYPEALEMLRNILAANQDDMATATDYITVLTWAGQPEEAVSVFEALPSDGNRSAYLLRAIARAYRDLKQFSRAAEIYRKLVVSDPRDTDAIRGLAMTRADTNDLAGACQTVDAGLEVQPDQLDLLHLKASIRWKQARYFDALAVFGRIIETYPDDIAAIDLRLRLLSDMGCVSLALEMEAAVGVGHDRALHYHLVNNMAAARIQWNEAAIATNLLSGLIAAESVPFDNLRARYDRILALHQLERMEMLTAEYEALTNAGVVAPPHIHDAAAGASLTMGNARTAIRLYGIAVKGRPDSFNSRFGLYSALVENGDYREAGKVRDSLEKATPEWIWDRGSLRYNWDRESVILAKGWWLAYQDRHAEAEEFFRSVLQKAPDNHGARLGYAKVEAWQGRPHQALQRYDILLTKSAAVAIPGGTNESYREIAAMNGHVAALDECFFKREARDDVQHLLMTNPSNKHTQRLRRSFTIDDSTELYFDGTYTEEQPGTLETYGYLRLTQPMTPLLDLYGMTLYRDTHNPTEVDIIRRYGAGMEWNLTPPATILLEYAQDRNGRDGGILSRYTHRFGDTWAATVDHQTFSLDVPLRARVLGIYGKTTSASVSFRPGDTFSARLAGSLTELDDGNENTFYGLFTDQALFTRAYWKARLRAEASISLNSETDLSYFSPSRSATLALTPFIEHTVYRKHDWAFVHRLFVTIGTYDQAGYQSEPIYDTRYEHDYLLTDWTAFAWGITWKRRFYDGDPTDVVTWYATTRKAF